MKIDEITPAELATLVREGEPWQILDVREPWELGIVSLEQAMAIPMAEIPMRHAELDRRRPIAVLCHSGMRSLRVAGYLCRLGFERVANVTGGIDAWAVEVDSSLPRY
ncbi:MAG: rhodanese-like domain-containing protein [Gammaproteobacteria bacterium]|jgi:rhodanese-related sulfurtransferase